MPVQRSTYIVPKQLSGERLDRVLEAFIEDLSKAQLQKLVRRGKVRVGGKVVARSNGRVQKGAEVTIEREAPAPKIEILHEDKDLLVVVKPTGLLTHAADRKEGSADLADQLNARYGPLPTSRGAERPGIVHRLDRETSGVLVVARNEPTLEALQDQFRRRTVLKVYQCIASGTSSADEFTLDSPLGPVPGKADRQAVLTEGGKEARTDVAVVQSFGSHSFLSCTLLTGRRHQIRVHLAEKGLPVVGDPLYGSERQRPLPEGVPVPPRLALHAQTLAFDHPTSGERQSYEAPLPDDLRATIDALAALRDRL